MGAYNESIVSVRGCVCSMIAQHRVDTNFIVTMKRTVMKCTVSIGMTAAGGTVVEARGDEMTRSVCVC